MGVRHRPQSLSSRRAAVSGGWQSSDHSATQSTSKSAHRSTPLGSPCSSFFNPSRTISPGAKADSTCAAVTGAEASEPTEAKLSSVEAGDLPLTNSQRHKQLYSSRGARASPHFRPPRWGFHHGRPGAACSWPKFRNHVSKANRQSLDRRKKLTQATP